jgi:hypothetical protein
MSTPTLFGGCSYVVGHGHKGKQSFKIFCNKLVEPMEQFCPKHLAFIEDERSKEPEWRALARRQKKDHAAAEREALALSPLRADNPDFDKPRTYTEAE